MLPRRCFSPAGGSGPSAPPVISQNAIVNAVTYATGSIAPGELISIFGSNFGATGLQVNAARHNGNIMVIVSDALHWVSTGLSKSSEKYEPETLRL